MGSPLKNRKSHMKYGGNYVYQKKQLSVFTFCEKLGH